MMIDDNDNDVYVNINEYIMYMHEILGLIKRNHFKLFIISEVIKGIKLITNGNIINR